METKLFNHEEIIINSSDSIGLKNFKVIKLKGRQVGMTTMTESLEAFYKLNKVEAHV